MPPLTLEESQWFEENLYAHEPVLRSWLACRFPSLRDELQDILQESFMKVLAAHRLAKLDCPKSFLFASARNLAVDYLRRKKVVQFIPIVESGASFVSGNGENIPQMLSQMQEHDMLNEAIKSLPRRCREVITLRKMEGLSHKAISEKLGISSNTVEAQVSTGVRKIRDYFRNYMKERG